MKQLALVVAVLLSASAGMQARAPQMKEPVDALDGLDPVLLVQGKEVPGKSALSVVRGRFTYLFSTAETKTTFEKQPATYEIQLDGICARMGKTAGGNPADFIVHDGKIYIFGSDDCHKRFQAAPQKYLAPPVPAFPQSSSASARGRQLLDRAVATIGPADKFDGMTSYVESFDQIQKRPQGDVSVSVKTMWAFPNRVRQERSMATQGKAMTSATVMSPEGLWFLAGSGQVYPTVAAARPSLEADFGRHPVALLHGRRAPEFKAAALGATTIEGASVQQIRVAHGAIDAVVNVDARGRIHSVSYVDRNMDGEYGTFTILYSDFRSVDGFELPFAVRGLFGGQPYSAQTWTVSAIAINRPLEPVLFSPKPASGQ